MEKTTVQHKCPGFMTQRISAMRRQKVPSDMEFREKREKVLKLMLNLWGELYQE
ncbi:hypothetical protein BSKO_05446 [Bryopsis sp. KO-2023]|nr:hypothetical protein BSKO_05446 [Bryopsis sp. KO-2023]